MSKIAFTIMLPHDRTDGKRTPGFFLSTSNMTYLNVKGRDFKSARIGNGNSSSGWKNRMEYGVTASKGVTKLSLIMNTSVILPPISWTLPILGEDPAKKKEQSRPKSTRRASHSAGSHSGSRSNSLRSSHSSRGSRESGRSRREEAERPSPRIKEPSPQVHQLEERDHRNRHARERRKRRPNVDPGFIDSFDAQ